MNSSKLSEEIFENAEDLFRLSFKQYKSIKTISEFQSLNQNRKEEQNQPSLSEIERPLKVKCICSNTFFGLKPAKSWTVYEFIFPQGLILIKNPFTRDGQRYWIRRSVLDLPKKPYITNIDNLENKEGIRIKDKLTVEDFYKKLRWVTFGYHHNWDTKVYSEESKSNFPQDLADLTNYISTILNFSNFKAEAAIANYYHLDSTLSGHVDKSEANMDAPLFSLSFGQPAVFLIGGKTKFIKPQSVLLESGDIAVMSGESRLSYHGVPRILNSLNETWNQVDDNVPPNDLELDSMESKRIKLDITSDLCLSSKCSECDVIHQSYNSLQDSKEFNFKVPKWDHFLNNYISKCRINLNIRQVLYPGQTKLPEIAEVKS